MLLYIDPGTGSMLFTVLIGVIGAAFYSLKMLMIKIKFAVSGGKAKANDEKLPFVIFSDDKRYWSTLEPIVKEMDRRGKQVTYLTFSEDDPALESKYENLKAEYIGNNNKAFARLNFLQASVVLSTTPGLDVYQWKRSKTVDFYVHIPHAANDITLYRMFGIDYYDAILLSGDYQIEDLRQLEKQRNLPARELVKVGIPYMDVMAERFEKEGPGEAHERTVLLAPSWGKSAILGVYGGRIIDALLKTGYHVIVRPHPQSFASEKELMDELMEKYPDSDQLEWNRDRDNFEVLRRSDVLITDFSGVIFDFSLIYDKPIIYTDPNFDLSVYDAWWLDQELWTASALPRLGRELKEEHMDDMKELIDSVIEDKTFAKYRTQVAEETWAYKGQGAEKVADYLIAKHEQLVGNVAEKATATAESLS